ncbi:Protein shuttle craft-like protein [Leptotrombidium deliense]|uniref:Protein shuttle craft-like protein n=1 Tax=Leptotrombidium deliense TaxID=299467 RepID=A0A443SEP0_9ACAR|nr:Protein shuttle craft-like protein [Leptotrombidium deliense]
MNENTENVNHKSEQSSRGVNRRGDRNRFNEERGNSRSTREPENASENGSHQRIRPFYGQRGGYYRGHSNRGYFRGNARKAPVQQDSSTVADWRSSSRSNSETVAFKVFESLASTSNDNQSKEATVAVDSTRDESKQKERLEKRSNKRQNFSKKSSVNGSRNGHLNAASSSGVETNEPKERVKPAKNFVPFHRYFRNVDEKEQNDESQREILEEMLRKGEYECMVCCEEIRVHDSIWNCSNCYNIFHLKCIKQWALSNGSLSVQNTGQQNDGWRCPACQNIEMRVPTRYYCFCGKIRDPDLNHYLVPHSCGNVCRKKKITQSKNRCSHNCNIQCHPGPCPPCRVRVSKLCCCGRSMEKVKCDDSHNDITCDRICNKQLNCGKHQCRKVCHPGSCEVCSHVIILSCFCGQENKSVKCNENISNEESYSCGKKCSRRLDCGNHLCDLICHSSDCDQCKQSPNIVTHCPCGKVPLKILPNSQRRSCTDVIKTCGNKCDKNLICGPNDEPHKCRKTCHNGPCSVCNLKTVIRCNCGANSENIECKALATLSDIGFSCKRRCNKKLSCGRHKCLNECCTQTDHECTQVCGRKLICGQHTCIEPCHKGVCPPCWNVRWEDLTCFCGAAIKVPPIACGTKPPECNRTCNRNHNCHHPVDHTCHNEAECPPCTNMVTKLCFGGHEERDNVFCYLDGVSCGKTCCKPLSCGIHECQKVCHFGECGECTLPCNITRKDCGHSCGLRCHQTTSKECPKSQCKVMLNVHCSCGRRTDKFACHKVNDETNRRIPFTLLASIKNQSSESIDVTELLSKAKENKLCRLECDEMCSVWERNRRLAQALNITEADLSNDPGPPNYSDFLKQTAREYPAFITSIYNSLVSLVKDAKQSKMNFKNLNFPPMRSDQRQCVHELCEFFGCKSHAVDREPHRSVIVKAQKEKCYLPTISVIEVVKKEDEKRNPNSLSNIVQNVMKPETTSVSVNPKSVSKEKTSDDAVIDYFDFDEKNGK